MNGGKKIWSQQTEERKEGKIGKDLAAEEFVLLLLYCGDIT
jgi:hypothetical protein